MKTIFDSSFRYRPSFETDIRKTFERLRREQAQGQGRRPAEAANCDTRVEVLHLEKKKHGS